MATPIAKLSGIFKPVVWATRRFAPWFPVVFVISAVSVISANPTVNSLFLAVRVVFVVFVIFVRHFRERRPACKP